MVIQHVEMARSRELKELSKLKGLCFSLPLDDTTSGLEMTQGRHVDLEITPIVFILILGFDDTLWILFLEDCSSCCLV
jgi:hypothetical protein